MHSEEFLTCLVLLEGVGDGGARESSERGRGGRAVPGQAAQQHLIDALGRFPLFPHQDYSFLQRICYTNAIFYLGKWGGEKYFRS